jgi:hypothetical protein
LLLAHALLTAGHRGVLIGRGRVGTVAGLAFGAGREAQRHECAKHEGEGEVDRLLDGGEHVDGGGHVHAGEGDW